MSKWITTEEFALLRQRNVFHRERESGVANDEEHQNSHILFRKSINIESIPGKAILSLSADDKYRLYINGVMIAEGPKPAYHYRTTLDEIDVKKYLKPGRNVFAFHTYYQGLVNRVWQSADGRHGLWCELDCDGKIIMESGEDFLVRKHSGYTVRNKLGYDTQFTEDYNSNCAEAGFEKEDYDDSSWAHAVVNDKDDHIFSGDKTKQIVLEKILPVTNIRQENGIFLDFGGCYAGYLFLKAEGNKGNKINIRLAQELNDDGSIRYNLRANCIYDEDWILSGNMDEYIQFDYKSFRYALISGDVDNISDIYLLSRHYPFENNANIRKEYIGDTDIKKVWDLCERTQKYGVQEMVTDCMEREKGVYLGDGCYTSLVNYILTGDDLLMRNFIEDAFATSGVSDTLLSCLNCSYMQEIAEYPLILVELLLWHYRLTKDKSYLEKNVKRAEVLLENYRKFESKYLLGDTGQWCVTEWPANYRDDYGVLNDGNIILTESHVAINAYYINAIRALNEMKRELGLDVYRDEKALLKAFNDTFFDKEKHLYHDGVKCNHISYIGNCFPFGFGLCQDKEFPQKMVDWFSSRGITGTSLFATFPLLTGLLRNKRFDLIKDAIKDKNAWLNMISEGGTTTFECWSKDGKWNTSLFHLQNTHIAAFISDTDLSFIPV